MTTLVIGARGSVGRHVLDQLRERGGPVRASVRDLAKAGDLPAGVEVVEADLGKPSTLAAALDGVRKVFVYASGAGNLIPAAREAGIEHVVLLSSGSLLLDWTAGNAITEEHREVEDAYTASGLPFTPIRPLVLANNALNWAWSIRSEGVVRVAFPDGRTAPVHERDIAAFAVAALTRESAAGEVTAGRTASGGTPAEALADLSGLLTGPESLSQREQVARIAEAAGAGIRVEELTPDQARDNFARFMPVEEADAILEFVRNAAEGGSPASDIVERVLGRPAATFREWAADHADDFR